MNQRRAPKGSPVGGQFTESRKPDGGDLASDSYYTPEALAEFEAIWSGTKTGFSEHDLRNDLSYLQKLQADLDDKIVPPRKVVGTGFAKGVDTRKLAENWIDERVSETLRGLATRGRSNRTNQMNVVHSLTRNTIALVSGDAAQKSTHAQPSYDLH
jgi:hypothetical protein